MKRTLLFFGGYTEPILLGTGVIVEGRCKGIGAFSFDESTGTLAPLEAVCKTANPSYILVSPDKRTLYCVNELKEYEGTEGSTVSAFEIGDSGELRFMNMQRSGGADACHLALSPNGRFLLAANYSGGSFCLFPIDVNGRLSPANCLIHHSGSGPDPLRQASPHPHQILPAPDGAHIYVSDLGLDCLKCYRADWAQGRLIARPEGDIMGLPGQGLRHGAFSLDGKFLYVMTELKCELNVYAYAGAGTAPRLMETQLCLPEDCAVPALGSGVRIHPNGRWLYCAVRGVDLIYTFQIQAEGRLKKLQATPCGGRGPREFALSPDGRYLLSGNHDTDNIAVFAIDAEQGTLSPTGQSVPAPCVTTLAFAQI